MELRKQRERDFHNRIREEGGELDAQRSNKKFYSIGRSIDAFMDEWLRTRCNNMCVLDFGCGIGANTVRAAQLGAVAVGIDISEVSIRSAKLKACSHGVSSRAIFMVMDGEELAFADNTFDYIIISGVLHHLDLEKAMMELVRTLRPQGEIFCLEGIANNPLIQLYRRKTPHLRTEWEVDHILRVEDIVGLSRFFAHIDVRFFHLFTIAAVPFRNMRIFNGVLALAEAIDSVVLRIPFVRNLAWQAAFTLSQPRKSYT